MVGGLVWLVTRPPPWFIVVGAFVIGAFVIGATVVVVVWALLQHKFVGYVELPRKTFNTVLIRGYVPWQQKSPLKSSKLVSLEN